MLIVTEQDMEMVQELTGRFVVKVQASLHNSDTEQTLLIYNQDQSVSFEQKASENPELLAVLSPEKHYKGYFWATLEEGLLRINPEDQTGWQDW